MISVAKEIPIKDDLDRQIVLESVLSRKTLFDGKTSFRIDGKQFHFTDRVTIFDKTYSEEELQALSETARVLGLQFHTAKFKNGDMYILYDFKEKPTLWDAIVMASKLEHEELVGSYDIYNLLNNKSFFQYITNANSSLDTICYNPSYTISSIDLQKLSLAIPGCRYDRYNLTHLTNNQNFISISPARQFSLIHNDWYLVSEHNHPLFANVGTFSPSNERYNSFITGKSYKLDLKRSTVEYVHQFVRFSFSMRYAVEIEKHKDLTVITDIIRKEIPIARSTIRYHQRYSDIVKDFNRRINSFAHRAKEDKNAEDVER